MSPHTLDRYLNRGLEWCLDKLDPWLRPRLLEGALPEVPADWATLLSELREPVLLPALVFALSWVVLRVLLALLWRGAGALRGERFWRSFDFLWYAALVFVLVGFGLDLGLEPPPALTDSLRSAFEWWPFVLAVALALRLVQTAATLRALRQRGRTPASSQAPLSARYLTAGGGRFTYRVITERRATDEELHGHILTALEEGRLKEPKPGEIATLILN